MHRIGHKQTACCGQQRQQFKPRLEPCVVQHNHRCFQAHSSSAFTETSIQGPQVDRRSLLLQPIVLGSACVLLGVAGSAQAELPAGQVKGFSDKTLAYEFQYPVATTSGTPLNMVLTRAPEKYSSAAPLTADARQRIVAQLMDLKRFVTVSVSVGPASGDLAEDLPRDWKAKTVAQTILIDRSTARVSSGQRVALNDVEEAYKEMRDGVEYWVYEHLAQGSPTINQTTTETYRHSLAVTSWRSGLNGQPYVYTLNLSCPEALWPELQPLFKVAVDTFRLTPTTRDYIPPDKDPWLFF